MPPRKRDKSHSIELRPLKVYLDDLELIVETLKQEFPRISINTDEYDLDDLSEISTLQDGSVTSVRIVARTTDSQAESEDDGDATVEIADRSRIYIRTWGDMGTRGVSDIIEERLRSRTRFVHAHRVITSILSLIVIAALMAALSGVYLVITGNSATSTLETLEANEGLSPPEVVVIALLVSSFAALLLSGFIIAEKAPTRVILRYKIDAPAFVARNQDSIILSSITLVIGFVAGLLTNFLF